MAFDMNVREPYSHVVATGNFDGLHLGHHRIFDALRAEAKTGHLKQVAVTYEPHTRHYLDAPGHPPLLTPLAEKRDLFRTAGIPLETLDFDKSLASLAGIDFVRDVILKKFGAAVWVFGQNHRFGAGGKGDLDEVRKAFPKLKIIRAESLLIGDDVVSSSRVREALDVGDVALAKTLLGRCYSLAGEVIHGEARGRTLGFPTANIQVAEFKMLPQFGVYAGAACFDGEKHLAVVNIGRRPTFNGVAPSVEIHLPGWSGDLYGKTLEMKLNLSLRGEMRFAGLQELVAQLTCDVQRASSTIQLEECT